MAFVDFVLHAIDVVVVAGRVAGDAAGANLDDVRGHAVHEVPVVAREDHRAAVASQRVGERLDRFDVEMVARLVEHEHVVLLREAGRRAPGVPARRRSARESSSRSVRR